jgi:hypothetical protein
MADGEEIPERPGWWERIQRFALKPVPEGAGAPLGQDAADEPETVAELRAKVRYADDKERLIGLIAAPVAAMVAFVITQSRIASDPAARYANGSVNPHHVAPSLYAELGAVTILLAVLALGFAFFRRRLYLGIVLALYGLSMVNLGFWGFGLPFLVVASWYLVRAWRLQQKLKEAEAGEGSGPGGRPSRARPNKRYTPPT